MMVGVGDGNGLVGRGKMDGKTGWDIFLVVH